ncbi:MAG: hypothetical protein HYY44_03345 [Deltaproteobacteria bacterium]|nr:hypothetical protein [Deltaproteobacteria bacterium]
MNPNVWYDPANGQVCLRNSETQNITCMMMTLACSLEQEHGHKFYRCVRGEAGDRMEIIYHEDPVTGKYLFMGSYSPPQTQQDE